MVRQSEDQGLSQGLAMLDAIAPRAVWEAFAYEGKRRAHLEKINQALSDLDDIAQGARAGELAAGDTFRAMRLLSGFSKSDLIRILLALGFPDDEEALLNWRIDLKWRRPSRHEKMLSKAIKKMDSQERKRKLELEVVRRVMRLRDETGCTFEEAIEKVAACEDYETSGLLASALPKRRRSTSAVRANFMAGMKWLGPVGYVEYRVGGIFGGRKRKLHFAALRRKGRRPKKG